MITDSEEGPSIHVPSIEAVVYGRLLDAIVRLELEPGAALPLVELAGRYGVSVTPVRQAVGHLKRDGLVIGSPRHGARVAPLTFPELEEIQAIRIGVESLLARHGAENCSADALTKIEQAFASSQEAYERRDADGHLRAQWIMRDACYACASRPRLVGVVTRERLRAERYLHYLSRGDIVAFAESLRHQERFVEACRRRAGDDAESATRDLFLWSLKRLRVMDTSGALRPEVFV